MFNFFLGDCSLENSCLAATFSYTSSEEESSKRFLESRKQQWDERPIRNLAVKKIQQQTDKNIPAPPPSETRRY